MCVSVGAHYHASPPSHRTTELFYSGMFLLRIVLAASTASFLYRPAPVNASLRNMLVFSALSLSLAPATWSYSDHSQLPILPLYAFPPLATRLKAMMMLMMLMFPTLVLHYRMMVI